jgi:hypothetical protein
MEDRLSTLYAYHKAKGLCYKCGLQYSRGHRCVETVSLQVVKELWQLINPLVVETDSSSEHEGELQSMWLSQASLQGTLAPRTMKFHGTIQGMD